MHQIKINASGWAGYMFRDFGSVSVSNPPIIPSPSNGKYSTSKFDITLVFKKWFVNLISFPPCFPVLEYFVFLSVIFKNRLLRWCRHKNIFLFAFPPCHDVFNVLEGEKISKANPHSCSKTVPEQVIIMNNTWSEMWSANIYLCQGIFAIHIPRFCKSVNRGRGAPGTARGGAGAGWAAQQNGLVHRAGNGKKFSLFHLPHLSIHTPAFKEGKCSLSYPQK